LALSDLSPESEIRIISETEVYAVFSSVTNLSETLIVPPKEESARFNQFLRALKKIDTDILYCRGAENNALMRNCIKRINARIVIFFGIPQKKLDLKCQILRIQEDSATLKTVMSFIPKIKVNWSLSSEIFGIINEFLKERGVKKDFFCVDVSLEENFYEFFRNYDSDKISFLFIGNSVADFSNEGSRIIYSGDVSFEYCSALVSLSRGCLISKNDLLLTEAGRFEKKCLQLDETSMVDSVKHFIEKNK